MGLGGGGIELFELGLSHREAAVADMTTGAGKARRVLVRTAIGVDAGSDQIAGGLRWALAGGREVVWDVGDEVEAPPC